jgi:hypothetical protein
MENKLDNLFKDQLSKHEETPSPQAWDQIQDQLTSKRTSLWSRRLAIAASIILIATVGFLGYRSLSSIQVEDSMEVTASTKEIREYQAPIETESEESTSKQILVDKDEAETIRQIVADTHIEEENINMEKSIQPMDVNIERSSSLVSEVQAVEQLDQMVESTDGIEEITEAAVTLDEVTETVLAEQITIEEPIETSVEKRKTYPKVRVVYKANQDSKLVASEKRTIIGKGINKITEFSDEHLLTSARKTKLRNTKEDLLALNFGKLLNKSNKDIEN